MTFAISLIIYSITMFVNHEHFKAFECFVFDVTQLNLTAEILSQDFHHSSTVNLSFTGKTSLPSKFKHPV